VPCKYVFCFASSRYCSSVIAAPNPGTGGVASTRAGASLLFTSSLPSCWRLFLSLISSSLGADGGAPVVISVISFLSKVSHFLFFFFESNSTTSAPSSSRRFRRCLFESASHFFSFFFFFFSLLFLFSLRRRLFLSLLFFRLFDDDEEEEEEEKDREEDDDDDDEEKEEEEEFNKSEDSDDSYRLRFLFLSFISMLNLKKDWRSLSSERGESCFVLMCVFLTRESRPKFVMSDEHIFAFLRGGARQLQQQELEEIKIFIIIIIRRRSKKSYSDVYHAFIIFIARTRSSCVPLFARRNLTTNSE